MLPGLLLVSASGAFVGLLVANDPADGPEHQATVPGNDLVAPEERAVEQGGRETPERPGGRRRHLFGH
ncbi:hypothetical protein AB0D10_36720 [Kitasatospora sp. NPDC048545]|uniref:hypothetical protein n=1 Tax=Kitasatospora sp. NPDC048545 TaxID=3157208 RepID=UPI0033E08FC6